MIDFGSCHPPHENTAYKASTRDAAKFLVPERSATMLASTILLLTATLVGLTSATCSPPAAQNISFGTPNLAHQDGSSATGPMELGMDSLNDTFLVVMWVPPAPAGIWNLVPSGEHFIIEHVEVPGKLVTAVQAGGIINLDVGPRPAQLWNITCATCPEDGFATDCTFQNFPDANSTIDTQVCIANVTIEELGNETQIGDCLGDLGTSFKIDYHL
ncbi:hypothetical protein B0H19DRAFT_690291 [Mycena capillaripes]|nr:hypothetical protein B0H19DRAFT_690291 [Mycena capillaripes]